MIDAKTLIFLHNEYLKQIKQKHLVGNMIVHRPKTDLIKIKQMLIDQGICSSYLLNYEGKL